MAKEAPPDAFGNSARKYELGRPQWPEELIDRVVADLDLGSDSTVLDLGAGTGKLTRSLVPRFARVIAVEPDDAMRAVLDEVVPGAEALAGSAEAIPLADGSVDAVFTAEAFHWYASEESVREIVRVLRPRGGLAIFWNVDFGDPEPRMSEEVERVLDVAFAKGGAPGLGKVLSGFWREPIAKAPLEPLREAEAERTVIRTRDQWLANMLSVSSIASLPDADREALAERLRDLVPDVEYRWSIRTIAYWARLSELRLSFGNVAETYRRVRPPYSCQLLDLAQETLELDADARVLDLGAGTGRLTEELGRRFAEVVAVEPDERMRALHGNALAGSAEAIPLQAATVDAVFVGEAFHWFDTLAAIGELARVLRPRGGLAIFSTHWWETEPPLPKHALELLREPYQRFAAQRNPPWDDRFSDSPFESLRYERHEEAMVVEPDELLELYSTTSSLAAISREEREQLFAAVRPLLAGPYSLPLKHELTWTRLV